MRGVHARSAPSRFGDDQMTIVLLLLLAIWICVVVVVVAACRMAAAADGVHAKAPAPSGRGEHDAAAQSPRRPSTCGTVRSRILTSPHNDQLAT